MARAGTQTAQPRCGTHFSHQLSTKEDFTLKKLKRGLWTQLCLDGTGDSYMPSPCPVGKGCLSSWVPLGVLLRQHHPCHPKALKRPCQVAGLAVVHGVSVVSPSGLPRHSPAPPCSKGPHLLPSTPPQQSHLWPSGLPCHPLHWPCCQLLHPLIQL